uniref:Uncharacterized protein n=1 Tax=Romanomermis culicivorax TaxID=13658 RepID=A0A915K9Z2_ROMCU
RQQNIRRLSAIPADGVTTSRVVNVLQPADPIAIIADIKHHLDCSLLCARHRLCVSSSFITVSKLCLLSQSILKDHEIRAWDRNLLPSIYMELNDEEGW